MLAQNAQKESVSLLNASKEQVANALAKKKKKKKRKKKSDEKPVRECKSMKTKGDALMACGAPARDGKEEGPDFFSNSDLESESSEIEWEDVETEEEEDEDHGSTDAGLRCRKERKLIRRRRQRVRNSGRNDPNEIRRKLREEDETREK